MVNQRSLSDKDNVSGFFEVIKVNFLDHKITLKLENIGLFPGERFFLKQVIKSSNVVLIKVNNVTYGIRVSDAKHIIVKKVKQ